MLLASACPYRYTKQSTLVLDERLGYLHCVSTTLMQVGIQTKLNHTPSNYLASAGIAVYYYYYHYCVMSMQHQTCCGEQPRSLARRTRSASKALSMRFCRKSLMSHLGRSRASSMACGRTLMGSLSRLSNPAGTIAACQATNGAKVMHRYLLQWRPQGQVRLHMCALAA